MWLTLIMTYHLDPHRVPCLRRKLWNVSEVGGGRLCQVDVTMEISQMFYIHSGFSYLIGRSVVGLELNFVVASVDPLVEGVFLYTSVIGTPYTRTLLDK